jgi:hypothetical protein
MAEPKLEIELRIERLEAICEYFMALITPELSIDEVLSQREQEALAKKQHND